MGIILVIIGIVILITFFLQLGEWREEGTSLEKVLPIWKIEEDCILSKQGDITVVFEMTLPEIFTLSREDYEALHQQWTKAIKVLPPHTILHKQDWFLRDGYQAGCLTGDASFLTKRSEAYFNGRAFLNHHCYLMLTRKTEGRKPSTSVTSNLLRKSLNPPETISEKRAAEFLNIAGQFQRILGDKGLMALQRLKGDALTGTDGHSGLIERYLFLSDEEQLELKDICFKPEWRIGENHCLLYTLAEAEDLPGGCSSHVQYDKYSTDKTRFPIGFAVSLGLLLNCNHIYNQYLFVEDTRGTLRKLERKRIRLQSLSAYSRENALARDACTDFLNEAIGKQRLPVKAHFNLLVWTEENEELKSLRNEVVSALAQMEALPRQETVGAGPIWWAGLPGNEADFPLNDTFDTFAEQACCFFNQESNYRSDSRETGIRFCDRLSGKPVYMDLFDAPRHKGVTANMGMLVCGSSGGGKSMTVNHILRSLYEQGAHCVTVDIGGSYKGLCELLDGYYFTYEENNPIRFNPFYLPEGRVLDTEKKESLKSLLVALWKKENESFNRSEYVALSNALQGYYRHLETDTEIFPCFNTFYEYLQAQYTLELKSLHVKDTDFDLDNFLYVLMPYYKGGEFDYLLNATEKLDMLNQSFVVFELDNIKDHPILFPVITLVIMELFISKMRLLPGTRKVLIIDEAWKAIARSGMAEFLKYAFKTIRKFNGIPGVITQELDDLVNSPIVREAIINNADVKILMDMRKSMYKLDRLQETLGISEKGKSILLSANKDDREIYIELGGQVMKVFRNELCPEEYFAYTTEGAERVEVQEYAARYGGMEAAIGHLIAEQLKPDKA